MLHRFPLLLALVLAWNASVAQAESAAESLYTRSLAATCANCHGTEGHSRAADAGLPRLAGRDKQELLEKLQAFRDGTRPATVMQQLVKGYTPAQLERIAAYFAAQH